MITELSSATSELVRSSLDAALLRHKIIANNIANHNVDGFMPQQVNFESLLQLELSASQELSNDTKVMDVVMDTTPEISDKYQAFADSQEKTLDTEMADMTKNVLRYESLIRALGKQSEVLGLAINGGRDR